MPFIEAPTTFYLGRRFTPETQQMVDEVVYYDSRDLTTHAVVVGMTGSGKTGLCITLLEEAAMDNIPAIIIDPKGDITNLLLTFPNLTPDEFAPWINPEDAQRAGLSVQEFATDVANRWREGLASWGIGPQRIQTFKRLTNFAIFTPGSDAGLPVNIVDALQPPREGWVGYEERHRERISGVVTALLALTDLKVNVKSREHVLLSTIIEHAWMQGLPLTLGDIIVQVQHPPFNTVGVFDVNTFFPEKDRFKLAIDLNNIIAAPSFKTWLQGEPLDIRNLLYLPDGRPRVSIFYIAHLNETQRSFIITLILENMLAWMRTLGGTSSLRAILYFDEVFGHFPPYPKNPPTKDPILRLLKQARAFGIGLVLATQNPGDLDYKGLSNAGTWFIGKLQTENDKKKVLDGLATASSAEKPIDLAQMDVLLSTIAPRVFVMNNVHDEGGPIVMHTRWAMCYLRGPLTRVQVSQLMAPYKQQVAQMAAYAATGQYPQAAPAATGYYQQPAAPTYGTPLPGIQPSAPAASGALPGLAGYDLRSVPTPPAAQPTFQPQGYSQPGGTQQPPPPPSLPELGMVASPPVLPEQPAYVPPLPSVAPQTGYAYAQQPAFQQAPPAPMIPQQPSMAVSVPNVIASPQQNLPPGYSTVPPSLSATVSQFFLPSNIPLQQAVAYWEQRSNQRAGSFRQYVLLYQPFLLAQCEVRYMDRAAQINTVERYAYHVPDVQRSGLIRWDEYVAPVLDPRSLDSQPTQGEPFAYGELPLGLTDKKRLAALEREVVDYIFKTAGIVLPVNQELKLYAQPGMPFNDFRAQVISVAKGYRDAEIDKVTLSFEKEFDRLEARYRQEQRELEADQASLKGLGGESLATIGEAAISLLQGRTTYTLSRVSRVRRFQEQARRDVSESEEVLAEIERQMDDLQKRFETEIARINDKWGRIANNITQVRLAPYKKDIHLEIFGIGWKPFYYVVLGGRGEMLPAWQGQAASPIQQQVRQQQTGYGAPAALPQPAYNQGYPAPLPPQPYGYGQGYSQPYDQGYGYAAPPPQPPYGYEQGYNQPYDQGYAAPPPQPQYGYEQGYNQPYDQGYGYQEPPPQYGYDQGYDQSYDQGYPPPDNQSYY